ncbi:MAG: ATP-dependent Clp protease proteolytic subunit, partial [Candidatus Anammoxibacter sp.]
MAELYIYTPIFDFVAEFFIRSVDEAKGEKIDVRFNTPGGDPEAVWGMIAKLREHEESVSLKVDGKADSAAAYFLLFFDDVEALNTSEFLFHRAHFASNNDPSESAQERLDDINKHLRSAMEAKLDIPKFEKIAGVSLNEFFNSDTIINVNLNAKKAKSIGLVKKITNLAPEQVKALGVKFAAYNKPNTVNEPPKPKPKKMTLEELKAENPEIYSAILNKGVIEGKATGTSGEKDRVQAWMAFNDVDPKAVAEGIEAGENLSQKATAEFARKALSVEALAKLKEENAGDVQTEESPEFVAANDELKVAEDSGDVKAIATAKLKVEA